MREREEEEGGEGNDALTALDASFETRRDMLRSKRDGRADRGLSFLADDIVDRFHKVAISKHRVSQEEQTVIDDQFFRHSFVYPDFSSLDSGLQEFIAADLIDISLRTSLEKTSECTGATIAYNWRPGAGQPSLCNGKFFSCCVRNTSGVSKKSHLLAGQLLFLSERYRPVCTVEVHSPWVYTLLIFHYFVSIDTVTLELKVCMCKLHVQAACASCMCKLHVQAACASRMCKLHVQAARRALQRLRYGHYLHSPTKIFTLRYSCI